ncbi:MAG: hypothetical protein HRT44_06015 [Bdellovibrionales bacterium]|nr:hypothetical protein [Bdellovibrionales bacterium]
MKKIFAGQKARAGEAGQAVVEYILMLVITVSIILGVLYQFNDAFKNYLDNYFGDYIACLLETGELPSLGGDGPTSAECNANFADFTVASGRPLVDGGSSGSGDGNGESGSGSDSSSAGSSSPSGNSGGSGGSRRGR